MVNTRYTCLYSLPGDTIPTPDHRFRAARLLYGTLLYREIYSRILPYIYIHVYANPHYALHLLIELDPATPFPRPTIVSEPHASFTVRFYFI